MGSLAALAFAGCPTPEDDYESVPAPDDDDVEETLFTGTVIDWYTDEPVAGFEVGIGETYDTTDYEGRYVIGSADGAPQQVDFYGSPTRVTSYADCETVHDHGVFGSSVARGWGSEEVLVRVDGYTDSGTLSGTWIRETEGESWHVGGPEQVTPWEGDDGGWYLTLSTDPTLRWWLSLSELDGGVVAWGVASGQAIEAGDDAEIAIQLSSEGLVSGSWDGLTDSVVSSVRAKQVVQRVENWLELYVPVLSGVPTGQTSELIVVDRDQLEFEIAIQRTDVPDCDWHEQRFDVSLDSLTEPLRVPELFDIPRITSASPGGSWLFRPEVQWAGFPNDPGGSAWASISASPPNGGSNTWWTIQPGATCGPETATWPAGLDSIAAESTGSASATYFGADREASCYTWIDWLSL